MQFLQNWAILQMIPLSCNAIDAVLEEKDERYHTCDYIGICHYRRYLINRQGLIFTEKELMRLLQKHDMITPKLLTLNTSYFNGFSQNHHQKDLLITEQVISEKYPDYVPVFHHMVHDVHTYFGNIFITSKERFDAYCEWLFDILFEVECRVDISSYDNYCKRLFGFLSEFLLTVYIAKQNLSTYECMVGMSGEKHETRCSGNLWQNVLRMATTRKPSPFSWKAMRNARTF